MCWVDVKTISKVSVACVEKNKKMPMLLGALSLTRHLDSKSVLFQTTNQRTVLEKSKNKTGQTAAWILRTSAT